MRHLMAAAALVAIAPALVPSGIRAQEEAEVQRTVRLENEHVLEGGVLELIAPEGAPTRIEVASGTTLWRPAETHRVRNPGSTPVRVLETEVKRAGEGAGEP